MSETLTRLAVRRPVVTLLLLCCVTLAAASSSIRLRSGDFLEGHLPSGDPAFVVFERLVNEFGGDQIVILALECHTCHTIFDPDALALVRTLSEAAASFEGVTDVRSLATASVLVSDAQGLRAERLPKAIDQRSAARFRALVEQDSTLLDTLVSRPMHATAILARFRPSTPEDRRNLTALAMRETLSRIASDEGYTLHVTGHVIRTAETDAYVRSDLALLTPAMVGLLAGLLAWIFRDGFSVGLALLTVTMPAAWSFGLMSLADRPLTPVISVMPILILVIGVTDAVHLLVRFHDLRSTRDSIGEVLCRVVAEVGPPTTVAAITSALGFLSFAAARMPNLRDFGLLAAAGIMGAWFTTFTLLPAALVWLGDRVRTRRLPAFALGDRLLDSLRDFAWKRARLVLVAASLTAGVCLVGIVKLVPENDALRLLGERDPAVRAEHFVREHLRPLDTVDLLYEPADGRRITNPLELERLHKVEQTLASHFRSGPILSILSTLRTANGAVTGQDSRLPGGQESTAQLLLLAESADAESVHRFVTSDRKLTRLSAAYAWSGSSGVEDDLERLQSRLTDVLGDGGDWAVTGTVALGARIGELVLEGQIASFSTAFATIFLVLLAFLRSVRLGALGMLPNVYPVAVILAFMGFAGVYLDVGTAMIASILLGVSVDDTVYFLMHYQRARDQGADATDAVAYTFAIAGRPALFCAGGLAIGFFVLGFSSFQSLAIFGLLSGVAVLLAVATELILMPAVLRLTAGKGS